MKYYIDESGNSGGLTLNKSNINFADQEYFTLACVGFENKFISEVTQEVDRLKKQYNIQAGILKFSKIKHLFGKKIKFIYELLLYLEKINTHFLIEFCDKKHMISSNVVNHLVNPPYYNDNTQTEETKIFHLLTSQWITKNIPLDFFIAFTEASREPSEEKVVQLFNDLKEYVSEVQGQESKGILKLIEMSYEDYIDMKKDSLDNREAYTYFLPLPDYNTAGKNIGMLPYVSCFTNIHARLNEYYKKNLENIAIVHDNQAYFQDILNHYHQDAIKDTNIEKIHDSNTDFNFIELSNLYFKSDENEIGLQIADIFAGFINKGIPYLLQNNSELENNELHYLIEIIKRFYVQREVNMVMPVEDIDIIFKRNLSF